MAEISRRSFGVAAGVGLALRAAAATTDQVYTVRAKQQRARAVEVGEVGGFIGRRLKLNAEYLQQFDVERYVELMERKKYRDWFWIGEQPGKWLEAAVYASSTGNTALREKAERVLERIAASQDADGYLGITDPAVRTRRHPMRGMDPYEAYYTFHGLLTAAEEWNSAPARTAAMRLGDFFIAKVKPDVAEFWPLPRPVTIAGHEVHYGLEGTLLLDPMMRLYETTGEKRYLDWCRWVLGNIDKWSVVETLSNLGKVAAGTMSLHQIQPKVHAHTLHMNMLGFLRLYETTGDASLLDKVLAAWRTIAADHQYVTGGVSLGESYREPHQLYNTGQGVETCAIMSWLLLNQRLLELTGNPAHADAMERSLWNHLLAAQTWDADGYRYFCSLNGWKPLGYYTGPNCCSSSGPRITAMLPTFCYGVSGDAVFVNQYVPSTAELAIGGHPVEIRVSGDYPSGPRVVVEIASLESARTFTLHVRCPGWCESPSLQVNGKAAEVRRGTMAAIRREWKRGDRVEISFPMEAKWIDGKYTNQGLSTLTRGPLVYAIDTVWTQPEGLAAGAESMPQVVTYMKDGSRPTEADPFTVVSRKLRDAATPPEALGPVYAADVTLEDGRQIDARLLPFANLGRWWGTQEQKRSLLPSLGKGAEAVEPESSGYRQGAEIRTKSHPYAVWVRTS
jgi:DUF1680 family protein